MAYSIDAARAQRFEATGADWEFVYRGKTYTLPREIPVDALQALSEIDTAGMSILALRQCLTALLGEQASGFDVGTLSAEDLEGLLEAWSGEVGISLGESQRSSTSSTSTPAPSKRISKPRTTSASRKSTKAR